MLTNDFLEALHNLNRVEKLRVVQILVNDLAADEEALLSSNTHYEIWSPYDSATAAQTLTQMLEDEQLKST